MEDKGKVFCDKCHGTGYQPNKSMVWLGGDGFTDAWCYTCTKCHGEGELFWVDYVMGGKKGKLEIPDGDIIVAKATYLSEEKKIPDAEIAIIEETVIVPWERTYD